MGAGGDASASTMGEQVAHASTPNNYDAKTLSPENKWIEKLDHETFKKEVDELGEKLKKAQGPADMAHLRKIIMWSRLCSWGGALTCWMMVNPVSIFMMSVGTMTRWTIIGHHVCHGGFDSVDKTKKYNRFTFGVKTVVRRVKDWLDWMLVEAWNMEHNQLHHYHLGEMEDPDLVEHNMTLMREAPVPMPLKYLAVVWMMCTWKWWYYAPNTYKQLKVNQLRRAGKEISKEDAAEPLTIDPHFLIFGSKFFGPLEFFWKVIGPYFFVRFVLTPLPFLALDMALGGGGVYIRNTMISLALAEIMTNVHSFIVIATNHAGDDLYRFNRHCKPRSATFYLRQIISSSNFHLGTDMIDFQHGWLNYQVEHHMWPDLSMLSYQKSQPFVEAICKRHGIPYIKQNVFWRLKKLTDIMVGKTEMRKYPEKYEYEPDMMN